jgi:hypothetical protein
MLRVLHVSLGFTEIRKAVLWSFAYCPHYSKIAKLSRAHGFPMTSLGIVIVAGNVQQLENLKGAEISAPVALLVLAFIVALFGRNSSDHGEEECTCA